MMRDAGRDEDAVLRRLEHVERLLVGEARVVDDLDAVAQRLLHRRRRARMRGAALAAHPHLVHRRGDLRVAHPAWCSAGDCGVKLSPERLSLIESTPYLRNMRTALRISSGAVDDDAEAELRERQVRQRLVAERRRAP